MAKRGAQENQREQILTDESLRGIMSRNRSIRSLQEARQKAEELRSQGLNAAQVYEALTFRGAKGKLHCSGKTEGEKKRGWSPR
jgi:hypothetical protein